MSQFLRSVIVWVEVAHRGLDGSLHGHSLKLEVSTRELVDLDQWQALVASRIAFMEKGPLEDSVGRTFEELTSRVLSLVPEAERVIVSLPSRGHSIEATR